MKNINKMMVIIGFLTIPAFVYPQVINWKSLDKDQRHILNLNTAAEYGLTFGTGYGYQPGWKIPVIFNLEYSFPSGKNLTDDFKTKIGGAIRLYEIKNFQFSARIQGIFRKFENSYAQLLNFGSDMAGIAGYYRPKWFMAAEAGFDKAVVTHFKHTPAYKQNFPLAKDGWYEPATGGNFYYGLQTGYSLGKHDVYLKGGKIITQDFSTTPLIPYYLQVGLNIRVR